MPTYQGMLKDPQIDALVAFIKSLNQPDGAPQGN
jgi:mono/diheme cytochrome c family protein